MPIHALLVALLPFISRIHAYYIFGTLLVNDTASKEFEYIRDVAPAANYEISIDYGKLYPQERDEIYSTNFTCGRNAIDSASMTKTATILPGAEMGFRVIPHRDRGAGPYNNTIYRGGYGNIYMAKVPEHEVLESWLGDTGDWFKIKEFLAIDAKTFSINPRGSDMNFTVPQATPSGKYLMRVEQFSFDPYLQFYVNCAHIEVVGTGAGDPGPTTEFPGAYNYTEINQEGAMNDRYLIDKSKFKGIGPAVWSG